MLNWLLRYQPAIRLLTPLQPTTVLEVGSGVHGLSRYWMGHVVQTDLHFPELPTQADRRGTVSAVRSTAERLPFRTGAFDVAVSVDMVEHLPDAIRVDSLRELFRVARRGVIVAYPIGRQAERVDRFLARVLRRLDVGEPPWLTEHLAQSAYPTAELLYEAVPSSWAITREDREHNAWLQAALVIAELTPRVRRVPAALERYGRRHRLPQPLRIGSTCRRYFLAEPVGRTENACIPPSSLEG